LTKPCEKPAVLPAGRMTQQRVEHYWAKDIAALIECGARHDGLIAYYRERDTRLQAAGAAE